MIPPGDQWTHETLETALDLGLFLVDSYYLALRDGDRFCWCTHMCSPYLDRPESSWFDSGLPVVGYFHDYELSLYGVEWMSRWLNCWDDVGARRFIDFREFAAIIGRSFSLELRNGVLRLDVVNRKVPRIVRPLEVNIRVPDWKIPSEIMVTMEGEQASLEVKSVAAGVAQVVLPS